MPASSPAERKEIDTRDGGYYVLFVNKVIPPAPRPLTEVRSVAALLVFLLVCAVLGISQRIALAVRQIQDRAFDAKAESKREWRFVTGICLVAIAAILVGTLGQSAWRCTQNNTELSADCVWRGIVQQQSLRISDESW